MEALVEAAHERHSEVRDQIVNWQAETLAGLIFRLNTPQRILETNMTNWLTVSIIDDLVAMSPGAREELANV